MGGKTSSNAGTTTDPQAANDQIVAMQKAQAAQAAQANAERNARLTYGKQNIQNIFEGTPAGSKPLDFSSITNPSTAPGPSASAQAATNAFYNSPDFMNSYVPSVFFGGSTPATPTYPAVTNGVPAGGFNTTPGTNARSSLPGGYSWGTLPDDGSGTTQYGIYDSSGNLVNSSSSLSDLASTQIYAGGTPGDTSQGGFQPDFYNKYRQSIIDYYAPQEDQQYSQARSDLSASLARAGQLNSSTAGMDIGKLAQQDALNRAQYASTADTQTGALRTTVAQDEQSALNQLYSTEDPSVAANTAQNMVANAQLTKPLLNPAGALFSAINVGVGNALTGFLNPTAYINPNAGIMTSTPTGNTGSGATGQ